MSVPNCGCHGEPMQWNKDPRYRSGGFYYCAVRHRERNAKRVFVGQYYVGMEHHFAGGRKAVDSVMGEMYERFKAKQAAERVAFSND